MGAGRRRLLPTAVVGGLLVAGMGVGLGTAEAANGDQCKVGSTTYKVIDSSQVDADNGDCKLVGVGGLLGDVLTSVASIPEGALEKVETAAATDPPVVAAPVTTASQAPPASAEASSSAPKPPPSAAAVAAAPAPAAAPAVVPQAPVVAAGAFAPSAGLFDADYAPALLANGTYDPSLLLGAAPGVAPLLGLATADPASAVTSASQVQAMALQAPGGLGLPAVAGVIILAGLGGVAVRYRLRRAAARATTS